MNIEELLNDIESRIDTNEEVRSFRKSEVELFKKKGFSEVVQDSYKFTNIESFLKLQHYEKNTTPPSKDFSLNGPTILFVDGVLTKTNELPSEIQVTDINSKFNDIKKFLTESNAVSHFHHSLFRDGVHIEIAKNAVLSQPIKILHAVTKSATLSLTNIIRAEAHSKLTLIEETLILTDKANTLLAETYVFLDKGANIEHITLENGTKEGLNHSSLFGEVERDASLKSLIFLNGGKLNRKNFSVNLNDTNARAESYSLFLASGNEQTDLYTEINHKSADSSSQQLAKGILGDESKGIFTGKIHIFPKAQRVQSGQLNKNLLLSKKAQAHSQPQLEIFADDVKCSHGSTTGQLSPDELFYFQARGIPGERAKNILATGFGLEIVDKIENSTAKKEVARTISENLMKKYSLGSIL